MEFIAVVIRCEMEVLSEYPDLQIPVCRGTAQWDGMHHRWSFAQVTVCFPGWHENQIQELSPLRLQWVVEAGWQSPGWNGICTPCCK